MNHHDVKALCGALRQDFFYRFPNPLCKERIFWSILLQYSRNAGQCGDLAQEYFSDVFEKGINQIKSFLK